MNCLTKPETVPASILIVEDERTSRKALAMLLSACGYVTEAVESAEEAMTSVDHGCPTVALVDVDLPGMNGLDFVHALAARHPEVFTVLMTAVDGERIDRFMLDHDVAYLRKPLDFRRLLELIDASQQRH